LTAPNGDVGTLLLDPAAITIMGGTLDGDDNEAGDSATVLQQAGGNLGEILFADTGAADPLVVFESEIENSDANIILRATDAITVAGTFNVDTNGEGTGSIVRLANNRSLTIETRNATAEGATGIDLTGVTVEFQTQGTGNISITGGTDGADGDVPVDVGALTTLGTGSITIVADGSLTISGDLTSGGTTDLTSQLDDTGTVTFTNTATISSTSGALTITADDMSLAGGTITAGAQIVTLKSNTTTDVINLGTNSGTAGTLELSDPELDTISTTNAKRIGASTQGTITVSAPLTLTDNLTLITGADVTQGTNQITGLSGLSIEAGASTTLNAANDVGSLSANLSAGAFEFTDINALTLGTVDSFSGITTSNGDITLNVGTTVDGSILTVNSGVTSGGGAINFNSDQMAIAAAVNASGGTVTLAPLVTSGDTDDSVNLGGTGGVDELGLTSTELNFVTAGILRTGSLTATGGLSVTAAIAPSGTTTLSLLTGGTVTDTNTITETNLAIQSVGAVTLNSANNVTTLAANVTGAGNAFSYTNEADSVAIGSVDGVNGITTLGGAVTVAAVSGLTSSQAITTTAGINTGTISGAVDLDVTAGAASIALAGNIITIGNTSNATTAGAGGQVDITAAFGTIAVADITSSGGAGSGQTGGAAGAITINANSSTTTLNGSTLTAAGGTGSSQGLGATVTFGASTAVILATGAVVIDTGATAGDILFTNSGGGFGGDFALTLTAGTGDVTFATNIEIGNGNELASFEVTSADTVTFTKVKTNGAIQVTADFINIDGSGGSDEVTSLDGVIEFTGAVDLTGTGTVAIKSGGTSNDNITFTGTIDDTGSDSSLNFIKFTGNGTPAAHNITVTDAIGGMNKLSGLGLDNVGFEVAVNINLNNVEIVNVSPKPASNSPTSAAVKFGQC